MGFAENRNNTDIFASGRPKVSCNIPTADMDLIVLTWKYPFRDSQRWI